MGYRSIWQVLLPVAVLCATVASGADTPSEKRATENSRDIRAVVLLQEPGQRGERPRVSEVSPTESFYSGDRFQFKIRSQRDGFVYVLLKDSRGEPQMLYPYYGDHRTGDNRIRKGESRTMPGKTWFKFDENPGQESVFILVAREPIEDLERIASDPNEKLDTELFRNLTDSRAANKGINIDNDAPRSDDDSRPRTTSMLRLNLAHLP